jgi:hypothetical protein
MKRERRLWIVAEGTGHENALHPLWEFCLFGFLVRLCSRQLRLTLGGWRVGSLESLAQLR